MIRTPILARDSLVGPLVDGTDQPLIAAWPLRNVPDSLDDFSLPSITSPPSRYMVRGDQNDDPEPTGTQKPPSKAPKSKTTETKKPVKPESKAPDTKAPKTKPSYPSETTPPAPKKPKSNDDKPKNLPPATDDTGGAVPKSEPTGDPSGLSDDAPHSSEPSNSPNPPPQDDDISPSPGDEEGGPPASPPVVAAPGDAESEDENTPIDEYRDPWAERVNNEQESSNRVGEFIDRVGDYVRDLIDGIFGRAEDADTDEPAMVPVSLPPPRNPMRSDNPTAAFRDGRMSQTDLESAAGRDPWTMCCATTFVYAVQTRYPGLSQDSIAAAFGKAADKKLADESGKCVEDNGYVGSLFQFSQAFSANLGLNEYVDVSGIYDSVEQAQDAGASMVKVEYSGTIDGAPQEHHTLLVGSTEIDPAPGGIDDIFDDGSKQVEGTMGLGWYPLP